jgi:LEA14-like dessication related protein
MTTKKKIILGLIVVGIAGIGLWLYNQSQKLLDFCMSVKGGKILNAGPTNVEISIVLGFENKSSLDVTVSNQNYDVFLNNILITNIKSDKVKLLAPKQVSDIPLTISFNPTKLKGSAINIIKDIASNPDAVKITFKGNLGVKTGVINLQKFPVNMTMTLKELTSPKKSSSPCKK